MASDFDFDSIRLVSTSDSIRFDFGFRFGCRFLHEALLLCRFPPIRLLTTRPSVPAGPNHLDRRCGVSILGSPA
eukprot:6743045-Pyramimonas_sp.AAC.1